MCSVSWLAFTIPSRILVHFFGIHTFWSAANSLASYDPIVVLSVPSSPDLNCFTALEAIFCFLFSVVRKRQFLLLSCRFAFCPSSTHILNSTPYLHLEPFLSTFGCNTSVCEREGKTGSYDGSPWKRWLSVLFTIPQKKLVHPLQIWLLRPETRSGVWIRIQCFSFTARAYARHWKIPLKLSQACVLTYFELWKLIKDIPWVLSLTEHVRYVLIVAWTGIENWTLKIQMLKRSAENNQVERMVWVQYVQLYSFCLTERGILILNNNVHGRTGNAGVV